MRKRAVNKVVNSTNNDIQYTTQKTHA